MNLLAVLTFCHRLKPYIWKKRQTFSNLNMSTRSSERQQHVRVEMLKEKLDSLAVSGKSHDMKQPQRAAQIFLNFQKMWQLCVSCPHCVFRLPWPEKSRSDMLFEQRAPGAFYDRRLPGGHERVRSVSFIWVICIYFWRGQVKQKLKKCLLKLSS